MLMLGVGLAVRARPAGGPEAPPPPPPPAQALEVVNADGWTGQYRIPAGAVPGTWGARMSFDPDGTATGITVQRAGFDATGTAVTVSDFVPVTTEVRSPFDASFGSAGAYTLQRTADGADAVSRVALAEFIHEGDVITGVTNNSTRTVPRPQFAWLHADYLHFDSNSVTLRALVGHAFARNGRPVAAVRFRITDGTNTAEVLVSTTTWVDYAASGLGCPAFVGTLDISALDDGPVTVDAIVYPWVGPAFQLSTDGVIAAGITTHRFTCTPRIGYKTTAGGIPTVYAYVSPAGNNATGVASTNPATAAASPFAAITNAITAIRDRNNADYGRNEVSGGVVRLEEGAYVTPASAAATYSTPSLPLVIEAAPGAARAATIIESRTTMAGNNLPARLVVRGVTLKKLTDTAYMFRLDGAGSAMLLTEGCVFDRNGTTANVFFVIKIGRWWLIDCVAAGGNIAATDISSTNGKNTTLIGCSAGFQGSSVINVIASRTGYVRIEGTTTGRFIPATGAVIAFNFFTSGSSNIVYMEGGALSDNDFGLLLAGNVIERTAGTGPAIWTWADGNNQAVRNLNVMMNTVPGTGDAHRWNRLYNDAGTNSAAKEGTHKFNVVSRWSSKTDTFPTGNAVRTGNWPAAFHVGSAFNCMVEGEVPANSALGPLSWRLQTAFPGLQYGNGAGGMLDPLWTDNATAAGSGLGGGDYTPQAASPLRRVPGTLVPYSHDLLGRPIPQDGTAFVGAVQRP